MKYQELRDAAWKFEMGEIYDTEYVEKINPAILRALFAELDAKTEALKMCSSVLAGYSMTKADLVQALEMARVALSQGEQI